MTGSFATFVAVSSKLVVRIPSGIQHACASTLGLSLWTSLHVREDRCRAAAFRCIYMSAPWRLFQAMYSHMNLALPYTEGASGECVLIWGGATACGMFAIQLAKASGYRVIATASKVNHPLVQSLGADDVFDYHQVDAVELIKSTSPTLSRALDCVATEETIKSCINALAPSGGHVHHLMPTPPDFVAPRADCVTHGFALVYTILGRPIPWATYLFDPLPTLESMRLERQQAEGQWFNYDRGLIYRLLRDEKVLPLPVVEVNQVGLAKIEDYLLRKPVNLHRAGKIVHRIDEAAVESGCQS